MTRRTVLIWTAVLGIGLAVIPANAQEPLSLKTQSQRLSYGIGVELAKNLRQQGIRTDVDAASVTVGDEVEFDMVVKGMRDALSGKQLLVPEKESRRSLLNYQNELKRKQARSGMLPADVNKREGDAFLTQNKTKEGVVALPSGLQYKVLKMGNGKKPTESDAVEIISKGTLIDGSDVGAPASGQAKTLKVRGDVIPGVAEALKLMPAGSKWQLFIPSVLAYGEQGNGGAVGPNQALIYEVELLAVK